MKRNILSILALLLPAFMSAQVYEPADSAEYAAADSAVVAEDDEDDDPFLHTLEYDEAKLKALNFTPADFAHIAGLMKLAPKDVDVALEDLGFETIGSEESEGMRIGIYLSGADMDDEGNLQNVQDNMEMVVMTAKDDKINMVTYVSALPDRVNAILSNFDNVLKAGFFPPQGEATAPILFVGEDGSAVVKQRFAEHPGFVIIDFTAFAGLMGADKDTEETTEDTAE
ncbi:MAG: hypothetical protein IKR63_08185 [Alloprevotella sp.]|nr:hypothetical protein [Alloprevotella sp.]